MDTVRGHVAEYLGCFLNETVMFPSTTLALNAVATGLIESGFLSQGDRVLTTDQEHAGGIAGWVHYSDDADPEIALPPIISLDRIPLPIPDLRSTEAIVADFKAHPFIKKVFALSHGARADYIGEECIVRRGRAFTTSCLRNFRLGRHPYGSRGDWPHRRRDHIPDIVKEPC